jgi:hypothetical protein
VIRLGDALAVNNRHFVLHTLESLFDNLLLAVCTLRVALSARYERGLPAEGRGLRVTQAAIKWRVLLERRAARRLECECTTST